MDYINADREIEQIISNRDQKARNRIAAQDYKARKARAKKAAWLATLKSAATEIGAMSVLMWAIAKCTGAGLIAPSIAVPVCVAVLVTMVWRACQYWHILSE